MPLWVKLSMWNDKKPWWQKKAKENQTDNSHRKTWCVVHVVGEVAYVGGRLHFKALYKPCAKLNAPSALFVGDRNISEVKVDNLTKQEAYEVAKGLNFLDRSDEWQAAK